MPAKSKAQLRFMQAVAHSRKFAKAAGVPMSVGAEFVKETPKGARLPKRSKRK